MAAIPKTLGACADRLHLLKEQKTELNRQVTKLEDEEKEIKEHLIQNLPKDDSRGVLGKKAKAVIVTKAVPSVKDWDKLYTHILKKKDFSFLQRRVAEATVREHWEAGDKVPGVESFTVVTVSVTKI